MTDFAILVSQKYYDEPYVDDIVLRDELIACGHTAKLVAWNDENIDFSLFKIAIIRSCWDYDQRLTEFLKRLYVIQSKCLLLNPYETIKENSSKLYLKYLQEKGAPIVPTIFIHSELDFQKQKIDFNSEQIIVKPVISASGRDTYRYNSNDTKGIEETVKKILKTKTAMIQPYIESIETVGERSTVVIDGQSVFTMKKKPARGSYLVHKHWGGTYTETIPTEQDLLFLKETISLLEEEPLYVRVDYVYGKDKKPLLLELELIEPNLYLAQNTLGLKILSEKLCSILKNC